MKDHSHDSHKKKPPSRKLLLVLVLTAGYMILEAVGGILSNSLALLADAGHMLADVAALSVSLFAFVLSSRPPDQKASFGYYRAEVIAALFNGVVLLLVSFFVIKEAIERLFSPSEVEPVIMLVVAFGGLLVNIVGLLILHKDKSHNLNVKGAWIHVFSDALGSVGCVISGMMIYFFDWRSSDAFASIIIAGLVCYSALKLILETVRVLMEHTPAHIDPEAVKSEILSVPKVLMAHDLHIWSITSGKEALAVHVVVSKEADYDEVLLDIQKKLKNSFGITHATIQLENQCQVEDKCH